MQNCLKYYGNKHYAYEVILQLIKLLHRSLVLVHRIDSNEIQLLMKLHLKIDFISKKDCIKTKQWDVYKVLKKAVKRIAKLKFYCKSLEFAK